MDVTQLISQLQADTATQRKQAAEQLGHVRDVQALEPLIACLSDRNDGVQMAAATALGQLGDERAVEPLIKSFYGYTYGLTDGEGSPGQYFAIVSSAAEALGKIATPLAVEALLELLALDNKLNIEGTAAAALGLGYVQDQRVVPALVHALETSNHFVRTHAASSLGRLGAVEAVEPLIKTLHYHTWTTQLAAAVALGTIGDMRAIPTFHALIENTESFIPVTPREEHFMDAARIRLRAKAARGLALIATSATLGYLETMLKSPDRDVQFIAACGFAYRNDGYVFGMLADALKDSRSGVQISAIEALGALDDVRAEPLVRRMAYDSSIWTYINRVARQTLAEMRRDRPLDYTDQE